MRQLQTPGVEVQPPVSLRAVNVGPGVWTALVDQEELPPHMIVEEDGGIPDSWGREVWEVRVAGEMHELWIYFEPEEEG